MSTAQPLSAPIRVGPECNGMSMTPDEFDAIEEWDDNYRYELIRGVLVVTPPTGAGERSPNDELGYLLRSYRDSHPRGATLDETLFEQQIKTASGRRRADRLIWTGLGRAPKPDRDVPTIAVEFVASSARDRKRDYEEKRDEYADVGIQEYWVVNRFRRTMTVIRGKQIAQVVHEGETYRTDLLPGFELPLARLLERADRYADEG